jgi:NADP-dependent aldehyde dehydrogenase
MGSINPVFVLPGALQNSIDTLAQGFFGSINLGVGQFCTCPGLIVGQQDDAFSRFREKLSELFSNAAPGTMLYPGILKGYQASVSKAEHTDGVRAIKTSQLPNPAKTEAAPELLLTDANTWLSQEELGTEIFGPTAIVVSCESDERLLEIAQALPGTLTATIHGTPADLEKHKDLIAILETKAGRLIFNGFPTGVEVTYAMHHGGPYPATADAKFTSVGTAAILRFLRPVCYQNFPDQILPPELQDENPQKIWRTIDGELTREPVAELKGVN